MGRKVHPYGFRLGVIRDWKAHWYAEGKDYAELLHEDLEIRRFIQDTVGRAGISRVEIERFPHQVSISIRTAKPGIVSRRFPLQIVYEEQMNDRTRTHQETQSGTA